MVKVILLFSIQSVTFVAMKKIIKLYRRWYYRRLYTKLLFACIKRNDGSSPEWSADSAFTSITHLDYHEWMNEENISTKN